MREAQAGRHSLVHGVGNAGLVGPLLLVQHDRLQRPAGTADSLTELSRLPRRTVHRGR